MSEKVVVRIKKLLALAESSNKYEAQNSLLKAQELLMKHKLTMKDLEDVETEDMIVEERRTQFSFTKAKWKGRLASLIADNLCCYCYYYTYRTHTIAFLGKDEDVAVAEITLQYAIDFVERESKKMARERYRDGLSAVGLQCDYALGFISGLQERYEGQKKQHQEWGLVLAKPKQVEDAYSNLNVTGTIKLSSKYKGNADAYYKGEQDGKNFNISDKVASDGTCETLMIG